MKRRDFLLIVSILVIIYLIICLNQKTKLKINHQWFEKNTSFTGETKQMNTLPKAIKVNNVNDENDICLNLTTDKCIDKLSKESNIGEQYGMELDWDKERYFKDKSKRTDSLPYVTGDTFRILSDYVLDQVENTIPKDFNIRNKAKIFVKTDYLESFFVDYFSKFKTEIILITHNSDYPITEKYKQYLEDSKLIAWFAQNPYFLHPKLVPIPIGFINAYFSKTYNEKIMSIRENYLQAWNQRKIKLYLNYDFKTNPNSRKQFLTLFESLKGVLIMKNRVSFSTYIKHLNNSKFVLCPRGNGLDTHRFYETLLMGAIPIVESSDMNSIYENSTVLVLSKLTDLTQDMLDNPQKYIKNMNFSKHVLRMETWIRKMYSFG